MTSETVDRRMVAVMFADIAGYTSLMQEDEPRARQSIRLFNDETNATVISLNGEVVQFYGDGCICVFNSAVNALSCARRMQSAFMAEGIPVRIGVHSGDVYFDDNNVYGDSVNIASRIESIAVPGSVLFSERIKKDIRNQPELNYTLLGPVEFKNVEEAIDVYALDVKGLVVPDKIDFSGKLKSKTSSANSVGAKRLSLALTLAIVLALVVSNWSTIEGWFTGRESKQSVKTVAVLDFENGSANEELDIIASMTTSRAVHGITQHGLARVITDDLIEGYQGVMNSNVVPMNNVEFLNKEMDVSVVFNGKVYADGDTLILECTVIDANTNESIGGLPTVQGLVSNPMKAIEEQRELILGYIAQTQDKELNLSLETQPPKYAAYREFLKAKEESDEEKATALFVRAIELDSNYFEPKVYLISNYYNRDMYTEADSLLDVVTEYFPNSVPRQRNLINFYRALLSGKNDIAYKCMYEEFQYAPFDLPTSQSVMVLGTHHTSNLEEALEVYYMIPEDKINLTDCDPCQIRLYVKGYIELEQQRIDDGIESGMRLFRNNGEHWAQDLLVRGYANKADWRALDDLIDMLSSENGQFESVDLHLMAASESYVAGQRDKATSYAKRVIEDFPDTIDVRLIEAFWLAGDTLKVRQAGWEYLKVEPESWRTMTLLTAEALIRGDKDNAETLIQMFESQRDQYQFGGIDYALARAYSMAGDTDRAYAHLKRAVTQGKWNSFAQFQNDFAFVDIRDSGEFQQILNYWTE